MTRVTHDRTLWVCALVLLSSCGGGAAQAPTRATPPAQTPAAQPPAPAPPQPAQEADLDLVGAWHAMPSVGLGMDDLFLLYGDGHYEFHASTMQQCEPHVAERRGTWSATRRVLTLEESYRREILGGKATEDDAGNCRFEDPVVREHRHPAPRVEELELAPCRDGPGKPGGPLCLMFAGQAWWRLSEQPSDYPSNASAGD